MAPDSKSSPQPLGKNALEKTLSLFSDVKPGEGATAVLLILTAFIMMGLYYILKPVREGLILSGFGAVIKSYSSAVQALLFIFVVPAYGAFAARVNRIRLLSGMTLFFMFNLLLFVVALGAGGNIGVVFYIWVGIFNFMIVSQFWAFANDLYTEEQGKRLFPAVGVGASAGSLAGTLMTAGVFERMSSGALMLLAAALLAVFVALLVWINNRESRRGKASVTAAEQPLSKADGFGLVLRNRYLLLVGLHVLILNLVNTVGEFMLGTLFVQDAIAQIGAGDALAGDRTLYIRTMYAWFFVVVNSIGLLIQGLLVSRCIRYLGVRGSLFIGPLTSLVAYGSSAVQPILSVVRAMKTAENANDYSTNNTVRATLFLPMSRDVKYKAKAAIDTFFARTGDALQALVVFVGTSFSLALSSFALVNVALVVVWLAVCGGIVKEHKKLAAEA